MLRYEVPNYRPVGIRLPSRTLGQGIQSGSASSQPSAGVSISVGLSSLFATTLGIGTTWVGIRAGRQEKKTGYKAMGYAVAVFGSLVVITSLAATAAFFGGLFGASPVTGAVPPAA